MDTKRGVVLLVLELLPALALGGGTLGLEEVRSSSYPRSSLRVEPRDERTTQTCADCERHTRRDAIHHLQRVWIEGRLRGVSPCEALGALRSEGEIGEAGFRDGWRNYYELRCDSGRVSMTSRGEDSLLGSTDDIVFDARKPEDDGFLPAISVSPEAN